MLIFFVDSKNKITPRNVEVRLQTDIPKIAKNLGLKLATGPQRHKWLKAKAKEEKKRKDAILKNPNILHVQLVGSLTTPDGYGNTTRFFYKHTPEYGVLLDENYDFQDIGLCYFPPVGVGMLRSKVKVLYTMFESTKFPKEWERAIKHADHILVPTQFCKEIIKNQFGLDAEVIPLGYDEEKFYPLKRRRKKTDPYTFIHYDAFKLRKGWNLVLQAFIDEFGENNPDVRLILKTTEYNKVPIPLDYYKNIEVIRANYEHEELLQLLKRSDCFVYPAVGEGFGLPPLEAMATGLYTICSYNTGMKDHVRPTLTKMTPIHAIYDRIGLQGCNERQDLGAQFLPDIDQLKAEMRKAYEGRLKGDYPEIRELTMKKSAQLLSKKLLQIKQQFYENRTRNDREERGGNTQKNITGILSFIYSQVCRRFWLNG
jgi:glycosyltransferase involved in cell wall biosynthesis